MQAMQYEITLPAAYDMAIIRDRVATRGPMLDGFEGLGLKAYLVRERGVDGASRNEYAPFYLWRTLGGMNRFLWGSGFRGLSDDFGRPTVLQWTGLAFTRGPAWTDTPTSATRHLQPIPADVDATFLVEAAVGPNAEYGAVEGCHSSAVAIDTRGWQLVHVTLWAGAPAGHGTRYQVLHLSAPEADGLPTGRHW